jgi:hypothetical protein
MKESLIAFCIFEGSFFFGIAQSSGFKGCFLSNSLKAFSAAILAFSLLPYLLTEKLLSIE